MLADHALLMSKQTSQGSIKVQTKVNYLDVEASLPELSALESPTSVPEAYGLYTFATRRLIASSGLGSFLTFYGSLKDTDGSWAIPFENAFGISPENFYKEFKKTRQEKSMDF